MTDNKDAPTLLVRAVDSLIRWRLLLLLLCLISVAVAYGPAQRLGFDRSIEGLFHEDDPRLANYLEDKRIFGGAETAVVAYTDPELLTLAGLQRLERLDARLRELPGVQNVLSLARGRLPRAPLNARTLREHLASNDVSPDQLRKELLACDLYRGRLLSEDGQSTLLLVALAPVGQPGTSRAETIARVQEICDAQQPPAALAGEPILVEGVYRHLEQDGQLLGIASSLVLAVVIGLLFRNLRWIILPLAVVHLTLIWTKALLVVSGLRLSMVSSPLVALVTVIGVATVVHVTIRFREERDRHAPLDALRRTLIHLGPAIFWTCLTTAAGFSSLLASRIVPVAGFGTMMALGASLVFFAAIFLLPGGVLLGRYGTDPARVPAESRLATALDRVLSIVQRNPGWVALVALGVLGLTSLGALRLQVATDFTESFRSSSPIVKSYEFLSQRMGTTAMFDVLIDAPDVRDGKEFDEFLARLRLLQEDLETQSGVLRTMSVVNVLDFIMGTQKDRASLMELTTATLLENIGPSQRLELLQRVQPDLVAGFWSGKEKVVRIVVQAGKTEGAEAKRQLIENVESRAREYFPSAKTAGVFILLTYVVRSLLADQWLTFCLAVAAILVLISIAFRDWRLGLIALAPNAAPILVVVGFMGWVGLKVNLATAMLASVSMGLSVDFSIHYLYRFRQEQRKGQSVSEAIRSAHGSVGLAMILANVALIAGFSTLTLSEFVPTVHFGILVSVAMLGGLLGNLVVLPLLLPYLRDGG